MYKHSTNRDVRYAERELHFVIPPLYRNYTFGYLFSSSMQKTLTGLSFLLRHWRCVLFYLLIFATELSYHSISTLKNEALVLPEYNRVNIITLN